MGCVFFFQITENTSTGYAFLAIFMIFLFIFSLGVGPVAWFIATELSPAPFRAQIQSLSVSCQYITCFISSLIFLPLYHLVGPLSFLIFITPLTLCSVYLFVYLPETKNRTLDSIFEEMNGRKKKSSP
uniref:MFS domain-containing protein n=2 Tax=Bursaphelenchus xylophilus TaxID=6326 RepID=A0A1I7RSH5_BURXY